MTTVQAPQSPSAQPSLVPVQCCSVRVGGVPELDAISCTRPW
eukprot:gene36360-44855_t